MRISLCEPLPEHLAEPRGGWVMMALAAKSSRLPQQRSSGPLWLAKGAAMGAPNGCTASSLEDSSDLGNPPLSLKRLFYAEGVSLTPPLPPWLLHSQSSTASLILFLWWWRKAGITPRELLASPEKCHGLWEEEKRNLVLVNIWAGAHAPQCLKKCWDSVI